MHSVKKILAFVDPRPESAMALQHAVALAQRTGATVTAMDVVEPERWPRHEQLYGLSVETRRQALEAQVARWQQERVRIDVAVQTGRPSVELVRAAVAGGHDLVIKTAKGRQEGRTSLFGTTAMHLIRKCPSLVWLVGPAAMPQRPRILAALDPGWDDDELSGSLAGKVLAKAVSLGEQIGGEVHVVHVWHLAGEYLLASRVSEGELAELRRERRRTAERRLGEILALARAAIEPEQIHLLEGTPEREIPVLARDGQFDLVVMGTVGRSGLAGLLIGEMAEEVLGRVDCGVLCVKPDGFVSPVAKSWLAARRGAEVGGKTHTHLADRVPRWRGLSS